jgi:beta-lactamase class A
LQVRRGLDDLKAFDVGINNTTTAQALARLLLLIGQHRVVSPAACDTMLGILKQQHFREGIPAQLPEDIEVGNKTGEITGHYHDAGLVFAPRPFVIVVLTRGLTGQRQSAPLIADLARLAYTSFNS